VILIASQQDHTSLIQESLWCVLKIKSRCNGSLTHEAYRTCR